MSDSSAGRPQGQGLHQRDRAAVGMRSADVQIGRLWQAGRSLWVPARRNAPGPARRPRPGSRGSAPPATRRPPAAGAGCVPAGRPGQTLRQHVHAVDRFPGRSEGGRVLLPAQVGAQRRLAGRGGVKGLQIHAPGEQAHPLRREAQTTALRFTVSQSPSSSVERRSTKRVREAHPGAAVGVRQQVRPQDMLTSGCTPASAATSAAV